MQKIVVLLLVWITVCSSISRRRNKAARNKAARNKAARNSKRRNKEGIAKVDESLLEEDLYIINQCPFKKFKHGKCKFKMIPNENYGADKHECYRRLQGTEEPEFHFLSLKPGSTICCHDMTFDISSVQNDVLHLSECNDMHEICSNNLIHCQNYDMDLHDKIEKVHADRHDLIDINAAHSFKKKANKNKVKRHHRKHQE